MATNSYLNIPTEKADLIERKVDSPQPEAFRFLYHKGQPLKTDFIPTFMDEHQQKIREKRRQCGKMASVVVNQHKERKYKLSDFSVSLFLNIEKGKEILWKDDSLKKDYPAIALGFTCSGKGYSVVDNQTHLSYYLFDYVNNNPYNDFSTIEEASADE